MDRSRFAIAARSEAVRAIVMVASFARAPTLARWLAPLSRLLPGTPPRAAIRAMMVGRAAPSALVDAVVRAIASVPPRTMQARIAEVTSIDVRGELSSLRIPVTWIAARHDRLLGSARTSDAVVIDGPHLLAQPRPADVAAIVRTVVGAA